MPSYEYLIVGGGMTGEAAARGIRQVDSEQSLGLIGDEPEPPYDRPPLSKGLWRDKPLADIWRGIDDLSLTMHLGRSAVRLDVERRRVVDDRGAEYPYRKLLLATGGTPRRLPFGNDELIYFRTLQDYRRLRKLTDEHQRFVIIGGGFIGSEVAAALAMNGKRVTMLFPEQGIGAGAFPAGLAQFVSAYYRERGVDVKAGARVEGIERKGDGIVVSTQDRPIEADVAVAGIGIRPNVSLAQQAGLQVDDGIVVDSSLRCSHSDIFAAGDVAAFYNPVLGRRLRVEHEDNANTMGQHAGQSMAGVHVQYDHLPFFYSDLFDLGYEAVGDLSSELDTVEDWQEPNRRGVVYYLRGGRVRGVLLWNVWEQVDAARLLMAEPGPLSPDHLRGRLGG